MATQLITCLNPICKKPFEATHPQPTVINEPQVSMLILVHEKPTVCPHCNKVYMYVLAGVAGVKAGWAPAASDESVEEQSRIIQPPGGFTM